MTIIKIPNEQPDHHEPKKQVYYVEEIKFIELVSRYLKLEARVTELEKKSHTVGMTGTALDFESEIAYLDGLDPS